MPCVSNCKPTVQTAGLTGIAATQESGKQAYGKSRSSSKHFLLFEAEQSFKLLIWAVCVTVDATIQERFARKNEAAELHRAFNTLDRNHDGVIDADELNALFLDMGHKAKKVTYPGFVVVKQQNSHKLFRGSFIADCTDWLHMHCRLRLRT